MLTLLALFFLAVLLFGFMGRIGLGLLILLPVILIGFLLLKVVIFLLPVILVIAIISLIMRGTRSGNVKQHGECV